MMKSKKSRIQQVFCNVTINALKFAKGGKIDIKLEATDSDVVISIEDNGPGMSEKVTSQLF